MNEIRVVGNAGRDAKLSYTQSGEPICNFSIADSYGKDSSRQTTWWNITIFDDLAVEMGGRIKKGATVELIGRAQMRTYKSRDGLEKQSADIVVNSARIIRQGKDRYIDNFASDKRAGIMSPLTESDIPF